MERSGAHERDGHARRWLRIVPGLGWALVGAGVLARLVRYFDGRSLWTDEATVALAVIHRSFGRLLQPLASDPVAPVGFLWIEHAAALGFGTGETALRLWPLLAALGSLPIAYVVVREWLGPPTALATLVLMSVSDPLVFYASELKPYSSDVLFGLLVLWPTVRLLSRGWSGSRVLALAAAVVVGPWFSLPVVFVCVVAFAVLAERLWRDAAGAARAQRLGALSAVAMLCAASFALHDRVNLGVARGNALRAQEWQAFFAPLPGADPGALRWYGASFLAFFNDPLGLPATAVAAALFAVGGVVLGRSRPRALVLLLGPLALALLASLAGGMPFPTSARHSLAERHYPYVGRVLLFATPAVLAVIGAGLARLFERRERWLRAGAALALAWLLAAPLRALVRNTLSPPQLQSMRPLVEVLRAGWRPGDAIFYQSYSRDALAYYAERASLPPARGWLVYQKDADRRALRATLAALAEGQRFWLVTLHHPNWQSEAERRRIDEELARVADELAHSDGFRGEISLHRKRGASPAPRRGR